MADFPGIKLYINPHEKALAELEGRKYVPSADPAGLRASSDAMSEAYFRRPTYPNYVPEVFSPLATKIMHDTSSMLPSVADMTPGRSLEARIAQGPIGQWADKVMSGGYLRENVDRWNAAMENSKAQAFEGAPDNGLGSIMDYFAPMAMTAYHGSPHLFDKFSMENIGTGEGAQAYGYGLYFAENPKVAHSYKSALANDLTSPETAAKSYLDNAGGDVKKAITDMSDHASGGFGYSPSDMKNMRDGLALLKGGADLSKVKAGGHLYEVDIPDEHVKNFLDWDAPLSEQPESIREAVKKYNKEASKNAEEGILAKIKEYEKAPESYFEVKGGLFGNVSGKEAKASAIEQLKASEGMILDKQTGAGMYQHATGVLGSDKLASEYLNSLGIKGIKYFDGSSRKAGEGTRNLVVFDDSIVKTLKRNNEPVATKPLPANRKDRIAAYIDQIAKNQVDAATEADVLPDMLKQQIDDGFPAPTSDAVPEMLKPQSGTGAPTRQNRIEGYIDAIAKKMNESESK